MKYVDTLNRCSEFAVNDLVTLDISKIHGMSEEFSCKKFFLHEPVKVLEVEAITKQHPYCFRYFVENAIGERMFLKERYLILMTKMGNENLTVPEEHCIESKYNIGAYISWRDGGYKAMSGKAVDVRVAKNDNGLPYFTYLIEFDDRTRKLYRESHFV